MSLPDALPGLPRDAQGEPVFAEPWQAKAFALTVLLHDRGVFTWPEWSAALAGECAGGTPYFHAWVRALEQLMAARGATTYPGNDAGA